MPFKLNRDAAATATVTVPYDGQTVAITYRKDLAMTWAVNLYEADQDRQLRTAREALEELVVEWDVLDDDDNPLPATQEVTRRFPLDFVLAMVGGIVQEVVPSEKKDATSRPGSSAKARSAPARVSTR